MEKLPKIDLQELKEEIEQNKRERRVFLKQYAQWLLKTPDKEWSRQQNILLNKKSKKKN